MVSEDLKVLDVDFSKGNRGKEIIITDGLELNKKRFLTKIPLTYFNYYDKIWIDIEKIDKSLKVSDREKLIRVKSDNQEGKEIQNVPLRENKVKYDVLFDLSQILDYEKQNAQDPKAEIDFVVKGRANRMSSEWIRRYKQVVRLVRSKPEVDIEIHIESDGLMRCWGNPNGYCLLGRATVKTNAKAEFCYPLDLTLTCVLEGPGQILKGYFGRPEEIDFRGSERCFETASHCYIYKDPSGNKFKIPNNSRQPADFFEVRQLMPGNEMAIPIYMDARQSGGSCFEVMTLSIGRTMLYNLDKIEKDTVTKPLRICRQVNVTSV